MKKFLANIIVFSISMLLLTSCNSKNNVISSPDNGTVTENTIPQNNDKTQVDTSKFISEDQAKEYALKKAEIATDNVKFERIELDYDDGVWQYEVDFRHGDIEYDVDVNAENGEILSFEKEKDLEY